MTKLEALKDLAAMVEAGETTRASVECIALHTLVTSDDNLHLASYAENAYNGSLDAAKALHEAVLPGWCWDISSDGFVTVSHPTDPWRGHWPDANPSNHARAWLLAILRALIAQGESK